MASADGLYQMDYTEKIQVGVKGDIVINAGVYKGRYQTWIEDIKDDAVGLIYPHIKDNLLPIYRDLQFEFIMEDSGALYVFEMFVNRVQLHGGNTILWARQAGYSKRIQRRQFLRVECFFDIMIFHLGYEARKPMSSKWHPAKAIDISLGGYRFKLSKADAGGLTFKTDDLILLLFTLSEQQYMLSGRGTRIVQTEDMWEVGVGFDSVPASVEKKLFGYIRKQEMLSRDE